MKDTANSHSRNTDQVSFPHALLMQILLEARSTPAVEICGLIAARHGRPVRCTPISNVATDPGRLFCMDPREQIAAFRQIREQGETLFGIYHSHPHAPAEPSATDINEAGYPDALHIIVSLHKETAPEIRAYRFCNGDAVPVELEIQ